MLRIFLSIVCMGIALAPAIAGRNKLPKVTLELIAAGLNAPLLLVAPPDGSGRRFLGEQNGVVYILRGDGQPLPVPFIDLRDKLARPMHQA